MMRRDTATPAIIWFARALCLELPGWLVLTDGVVCGASDSDASASVNVDDDAVVIVVVVVVAIVGEGGSRVGADVVLLQWTSAKWQSVLGCNNGEH